LEHIQRRATKNDPRDARPLLQGQIERAGALQPGEEKTLGRPDRGLSVPKLIMGQTLYQHLL